MLSIGHHGGTIERSFRDDYLDRLRFLAEECHSLSSFTVLSDAYDGFGGLTASLLEEVRDEYSGTCIVGFISSSPELSSANAEQSVKENLNMAFCLASLLETITLTVPLAPFKVKMPYRDLLTSTGALRRYLRSKYFAYLGSYFDRMSFDTGVVLETCLRYSSS